MRLEHQEFLKIVAEMVLRTVVAYGPAGKGVCLWYHGINVVTPDRTDTDRPNCYRYRRPTLSRTA